MTLSPIPSADPVIQLHIAAALLGIILGPFALYLKPGTGRHKYIGRVWVGAMAVLALSSFAIHSFAVLGPFSPLHGLALLTLWSLWEGVRWARMGQIAAHRRVFRNLYWFGVLLAGVFNFLPGRVINRAVLPDLPELGFVVISLAVLAGVIAMIIPKLWKIAGGRPARS